MPPHPVDRDQTHRFLVRSGRLRARRAAWLRSLLDSAGVSRRHTCVPEFHASLADGEADAPADADWEAVLGGLAGRMARYREVAADLGEQAARKALKAADIGGDAVTHLVWVTCTGFENPGPDLVVADRLGLPPDTHRVQVGFMGCQAAVQGLRLADAICRSEPQAVVLLVCVELCSLHFDPARTDPEHLVVCSLFADGASAAVLSCRCLAPDPLLRLQIFASRRVASTADLLTWELGEPAFRMGLSRRLPEVVQAEVAGFVQALTGTRGSGCGAPSGVQPGVQDGARGGAGVAPPQTAWAVHPGGRAVLDAVETALQLPAAALAPSRSVLDRYGNMSSPTLLFVLAEAARGGDDGVALAFGPGLSLEGFTWSGSAGTGATHGTGG